MQEDASYPFLRPPARSPRATATLCPGHPMRNFRLRYGFHHHSLQFGSTLLCSILASAALLVTGCGGGTSSTTASVRHDWTWVGGSQTASQPGVYGTQGEPSTQNIPGARTGSAFWTDRQGNFWLFGGVGFANSQSTGSLNDVWEYQPSSNQWTWVSGTQQANQPAVFGTIGVASANNIPVGRINAQTWTDLQGNLWLFSGNNTYSDMWKFTPSSAEWTFMGGSTQNNFSVGPPKGIYGTLGQPAATNLPGPRIDAITWTDAQGNFWMYGGTGYDINGKGSQLGDLWRFTPANAEWTWMGGSSTAAPPASYGTKAVASSSNTPGGRSGSAFWSDGQGNLWLYGGIDSEGYGSDLWKYSNGEWTWIAGSNQPNQPVYGTEGVPSPISTPGGRNASASWMDAQGNLWLFGGSDVNALVYNDLWEFTNGQWLWVNGPVVPSGYGSFGVKGVGSSSNQPPPRIAACGWVDSSGNLWLFSGSNLDIGRSFWNNDLWEFTP